MREEFHRNGAALFAAVLILAGLSSAPVSAATITSAQDGLWSDTATWAGSVIPTGDDAVVIAAPHEITFDRNDTERTVGQIDIMGGASLRFQRDAGPRRMQVFGNINVYGLLDLVPGSTLAIECETNGQYGIIVYSGGTLRGRGSVPTVLTTLTTPLAVLGTTITVANASGFGVGDIIAVGEGAETESFTIQGMAGNTITLDRGAWNGQVVGAEVFKMASVTTDSVSDGDQTLRVSALGGIQAGDQIAVIQGMGANESATSVRTRIVSVNSIDPDENSLSLTNPLPNSNAWETIRQAFIVKISRDARIVASTQDSNHNSYIRIGDGGRMSAEYLELGFIGNLNGSPEYGIRVNGTGIIENFQGCSLHQNDSGILLNGQNGAQFTANIFVSRYGGGVSTLGSSGGTNVSSNIFAGIDGGWAIEFQGSNNNLASFNQILAHFSTGIFLSSQNNAAILNTVSHCGDGIWISNTYTLVHNNALLLNNRGLYSNGIGPHWIVGNRLERNSVGVGAGWGDMSGYLFAGNRFQDNTQSVSFYQSSSSGSFAIRDSDGDPPIVFIDPTQNYRVPDGASVIAQGIRGFPGLTRISGDLSFLSGSRIRANYADRSYLSSGTSAFLFRGNGHTIASISTNNETTLSEVWALTYRQAIGDWEVKGSVSGLQIAPAQDGVPYTSDNGRIGFTLTQSPSPQEGDQIFLVTTAAANDANTQKQILFGRSGIADLNGQSRVTVDPGATLETVGTEAAPTIIAHDGMGHYRLRINGNVSASNFSVRDIAQDGVLIDSGATIASLQNGSFSNVEAGGTHLHIASQTATFENISFDNTGAYEVTVSDGADVTMVRSQRGRYADNVLDTASISWDDPQLGHAVANVLGTIIVDQESGIVTIPFRIQDPNSESVTFVPGSFQYSTNGGISFVTAADAQLSGIESAFATTDTLDTAPEHQIVWSAGSILTQEADLRVRFRVRNNSVMSNYAVSDSVVLNTDLPAVAVTSPNGGESLSGGRGTDIRWTAEDAGSGIASNGIAMFYRVAESEPWVPIASGLANTGTYRWMPPAIESNTVQIRITARDVAGQEASDESDGVFSIASPPIVTVTSPNGGEVLRGASSTEIRWTATAGSSSLVALPISIDYSLDNGATWENITSGEANDGAYTWNTPEADVSTAKVRITATDDTGRATPTQSAATFTIDSTAPIATLSNPTAGSIYGSFVSISWTATDENGIAQNSALVESSQDEGGSFQTVSTNASTYASWNPSVLDNNQNVIRVTVRDSAGNTSTVESGIFSVASIPQVNITSPTGNTAWRGGTARQIEWTATDSGDNLTENPISIEYRTGGGAWTLIATNEANDGMYVWTLPDVDASYAEVRLNAFDATENVGFSTQSLQIDGLPPSVELIAPNDGQPLMAGAEIEITWEASDTVGLAPTPITLSYSTDGGASFEQIASGLSNAQWSTTGSYNWMVPAIESANYRIRVEAVDGVGRVGSAMSDSDFAVVVPPVGTVLSPNGGEIIAGESPLEIRWATFAADGVLVANPISLHYSADSGVTWELIAENIGNSGTYTWNVPKVDSRDAHLRVTVAQADGTTVQYQSNATFTIDSTSPTVVVHAPVADDQFGNGEGGNITVTIRSTQTDENGLEDGPLQIDYSTDGGTTYTPATDNGWINASTDSISWSIRDSFNSNTVKLRITATDKAGNAGTGESGIFSVVIRPVVTLTSSLVSPLRGGEGIDLAWRADAVLGGSGLEENSVKIEFRDDSRARWTEVATALPLTGNYLWTIPSQTAQNAQIRIAAHDTSGNEGSILRTFDIDNATPTVRVLIPNGGETLHAGQDFTIEWELTDDLGNWNFQSNPIDIHYTADEGATYVPIAQSVANLNVVTGNVRNGNYSWRVPSIGEANIRVRVTARDRADRLGMDESDTPLALVVPNIGTVLSPNGGEFFEAGTNMEIRWTSTDGSTDAASYTTSIFYSTDGEIWNDVARNASNSGSYNWTIPADLNSENVRVRVTVDSADASVAQDDSDNVFDVSNEPVSLAILSPASNASIVAGTVQEIRWQPNRTLENKEPFQYVIYYATQEAAPLITIGAVLSNSNSFHWNVPNLESQTVRIEVEAGYYENVDEFRSEFRRVSSAVGPLAIVLTDDTVAQATPTPTPTPTPTTTPEPTSTPTSTPPPPPTIDQMASTTPLLSHTFTGSRADSSHTIRVNGTSEGVQYPSNTTWSYSTPLREGQNTFYIIARNPSGQESTTVSVSITVAKEFVRAADTNAYVEIPLGHTVEDLGLTMLAGTGEPLEMKGATITGKPVGIQLARSAPAGTALRVPRPANMTNPKLYYLDEENRKWRRASDVQMSDEDLSLVIRESRTYALFDVKDTQAPHVSEVRANNRSATASMTITRRPTFQIVVEDDHGIDVSSIRVEVDGKPIAPAAAPRTVSISALSVSTGSVQPTSAVAFQPTSDLSDGERSVRIEIADEVGNVTSWEGTFHVLGHVLPGLLVYPNPYRGDAAGVRFDGLTGDNVVRIYDITGRLVWTDASTFGATITWDGRNSFGSRVAPGVYLYVVAASDGRKEVGKLAVIE